jgi:DNA-binding NtrC family response regulator
MNPILIKWEPNTKRDIDEILTKVEDLLIEEAMKRSRFKIKGAAELLGLKRTTLVMRLKARPYLDKRQLVPTHNPKVLGEGFHEE